MQTMSRVTSDALTRMGIRKSERRGYCTIVTLCQRHRDCLRDNLFQICEKKGVSEQESFAIGWL